MWGASRRSLDLCLCTPQSPEVSKSQVSKDFIAITAENQRA